MQQQIDGSDRSALFPRAAPFTPAALAPATTSAPTAARRRNRRFNDSLARDPDYDRSLLPHSPVLPVPVEESAQSSLFSSGELPGPRMLYDPKTDPIPALKPAGATRKETSIGGRRKPRRRRRNLDSRNDESVQDVNDRRPNGRLYNPESEGDDADLTAEHEKEKERPREKKNERQNKGTRESGKIMVLKNPNTSPDQPQSQSRIVPQLDYYRETVEEIELKVRSIYTKIVYLEGQTVDMGPQPDWNEALWWDVIRLHERLIDEYEDFLTACNLVNATPAILNLPRKYKISSRLWKNGISKLIEQLRLFLPESFDSLVSFICYTYKTMTRLYEFIPTDKETWLECLGDLARCRMAIEYIPEERKLWQEVAFAWYTRCSLLTPGVGRLYHHLALSTELALLDQIFYHCKSLMACTPFPPARESILPLFGTAFDSHSKDVNKAQLTFAKAHGMMFTRIQLDDLESTCNDFLRLVNRPAAWKVDGVKYAVINIAGLYQYGAKDGLLNQLDTFESLSAPDLSTALSDLEISDSAVKLDQYLHSDKYKAVSRAVANARRLAYATLKLALTVGSAEHYPHIFTWLVFLDYLRSRSHSCTHLLAEFPWQELLYFLKTMTYIADEPTVLEWEFFPSTSPLPEDWALNGIEWASKFWDDEYFEQEFDYDALELERAGLVTSLADDVARVDRILWLGFRLARDGKWFTYDVSTKQFSLSQSMAGLKNASEFDADVDPAG